jgi:glycosyltransferase involved in cell wall biosynthesis
MRIIIISPVYPYRGGIAHDTALMAKSLSKKHDVSVVSFSLLYPKIFYPGTSQKDGAESDFFKVENTAFLINSINPFSYIKTASFIKKQKPDLLIFQWWHPFFAPAYRTILMILNKKIKVLFVCHNVLPHERFPFQKILVRALLRKSDFFIVHSPLDEENLKALVPQPVYKRTIVPTYTVFNRTDLSRREARLSFQIDGESPVLLFFGFIREYKGLKFLIRAMPEVLKKIPAVRLIIAGDVFDKEKQTYIDMIRDSAVRDAVLMINKYIPDEDVARYFIASDLVVLPYESATQSGIAQIAFGFSRPVVVTGVGGLPDIVKDGKTGYIVPPCNSASIAEAVTKFFSEKKAEEFKMNIDNEIANNTWDHRSKIIEELAGVKAEQKAPVAPRGPLD